MIEITRSDLPFLRFVMRHQLDSAFLRRVCEHPDLNALQSGNKHYFLLDFQLNLEEKQKIQQMVAWWMKAEYQGITTRLLERLGIDAVKPLRAAA